MSPSESVGAAKTERACDGCLRCRARWYCAADDAFLCHPCDSSVHAANRLARRHERVSLRTAASGMDEDDEPTWHHGCKRKARSPRGPQRARKSKDEDADEKGRGAAAGQSPETTVPDIAEQRAPVEDQQLLYRVPILNPVLSEFRWPPPSSEDEEKPPVHPGSTHRTPVDGTAAELLLPPGIDLAGFDVDVESLLGEGLGEDAFVLELLSPVESHKDSGGSLVPVKQEEGVDDNDASSPAVSSWRLIEGRERKPTSAGDCGDAKRGRRRIKLSLDYEAVISAWSSQGCPWADGTRPKLNPDDCWPHCTGPVSGAKTYGSGGGGRLSGREARVSRYRKKRRTRLFTKKIRYEVRKLNAEKRPRMKGRFVKRSSLAACATAAVRLLAN